MWSTGCNKYPPPPHHEQTLPLPLCQESTPYKLYLVSGSKKYWDLLCHKLTEKNPRSHWNIVKTNSLTGYTFQKWFFRCNLFILNPFKEINYIACSLEIISFPIRKYVKEIYKSKLKRFLGRLRSSIVQQLSDKIGRLLLKACPYNSFQLL